MPRAPRTTQHQTPAPEYCSSRPRQCDSRGSRLGERVKRRVADYQPGYLKKAKRERKPGGSMQVSPSIGPDIKGGKRRVLKTPTRDVRSLNLEVAPPTRFCPLRQKSREAACWCHFHVAATRHQARPADYCGSMEQIGRGVAAKLLGPASNQATRRAEIDKDKHSLCQM